MTHDDIDPMFEEDWNDIPVIDSSAILRAVSYIPSDHEIGSGGDDDDDDDDDDDEEWIDERNERTVFTFSFGDEDFWKWKDLCKCLFYSNYEKILWCFRVTIQKLFIVSDNPTFAKEKFLNYQKLWFVKISPHEKFENVRFAKISIREIFAKGWFTNMSTPEMRFFWPREN